MKPNNSYAKTNVLHSQVVKVLFDIEFLRFGNWKLRKGRGEFQLFDLVFQDMIPYLLFFFGISCGTFIFLGGHLGFVVKDPLTYHLNILFCKLPLQKLLLHWPLLSETMKCTFQLQCMKK